eukprot:TRINITY_DN2796_c0_g1_i1.p1 TRINITY_DN2796_c0_g1~~TRINITY_DN2796_c0_g1_i1.p1  ORF type:complete len:130 (+),score=9.47 TRINITY_DN2796_c0_g1_i1:150-539(+)
MRKEVKVIFGLALCTACGLLLNILACALYGVWWPIFVVFAYIIAPLPNIICANCNRGYEYTHGNKFKNVGYFLTGVCVVSGFALPGVLTHMGLMDQNAMYMGLGGGLIVYGSILVYLHCFHKPETGDFY